MQRKAPILAGVVMAAMAVLALGVTATAQPRWSDKTKLTFDGPVMVPGHTLPAGSYWFKLADTQANRQIVQIWDEKEMNLITTTIAVPTRLDEVSDDVVVRFNKTETGTPALKAWFYPGKQVGHLLVYPEQQAQQIARASKTLVLSGDTDPTHTGTAGAMFDVDEHGNRRPHTSDAPNVHAGAADSSDERGDTAEPAAGQTSSGMNQASDSADRTAPATQSDRAAAQASTTRRDASPSESARTADADARKHLDELDRLLIVLLGPEPVMSEAGSSAAPSNREGVTTSGSSQPVGTSGTMRAANQAGTITIDRARLEELRMHLAQARKALDRLASEQKYRN